MIRDLPGKCFLEELFVSTKILHFRKSRVFRIDCVMKLHVYPHTYLHVWLKASPESIVT